MSRCIDLTGQQFGEWTVLERAENDKRGQAMWKCQCSCGTIKNIVGSTLRNGTSKSCGCKRTENSRENNGTFINEIGNRFGKLVVIAKNEKLSKQKHRAMWICKCDCGNYKTVSSKCLRDGKTKSCGCLISVGEESIIKILTQLHITFYPQYSVRINGICYRFDFAIMKDERLYCLIECHGLQHYDDKYLHWGKEASVVKQRDEIKREWAKENNVPLYEIPYWELDNIDNVLDDIFKNMEEAQEVVN
jgi:hypothetical protein